MVWNSDILYAAAPSSCLDQLVPPSAVPSLNCTCFYEAFYVHLTRIWLPVSLALSVSYVPSDVHDCPGGLAAHAVS